MNKKVVWLPYDMDTALGINNSGLLTFSYNLEDTDLQEGGEFIFNGQDSVMWTNLRDAFGDQIKSMYQQLRSERVLSYDVVEQMFEEHQSKWPEAIFNEDSFYKYLEPLINDNDGTYLGMLQGSKAEQRKWWLYNRFRYMDSKYNAGDAQTDTIMMRSYAVGDISITPYADIYATTAWDGELTQVRASKGQTYVLPCPKDSANDAVVAIYSASQLADIGDLSVLKIKSGDFSRGTKLQSLKVGDADENYSNTNLISLSLGNNTLLKTLDVRNCPNLATTITLTGCSNIEEVYFDGTSITGVELPNGGILRVLHLPSTITSLTIRNQPELEDLTVPSFSNVTTLWLENVGSVDTKTIAGQIAPNGRTRLIGIDWEMSGEAELKNLFDIINTHRGLDENGNNVATAQLTGSVYSPVARTAYLNVLRNTYPYVTFTADSTYSLVQKYIQGDAFATFPNELITYIKPLAFTRRPGLGAMSFPNATRIGGQAFEQATSLTSIDIPSVTVIGGSAFINCSNLVSVNAPLLTDTGDQAFDNCQKLKNINIPSLTRLRTTAFRGCKALETVNMPSVSNIYAQTFDGCSSLKEFSTQVSITEDSDTYAFGNYAFRNCTSLTRISIPCVTRSWTGAFIGCTSLVDVDLPNMKRLNRGDTFSNCTSLRVIKLPSLLRFSDGYGDSFENCTALEIIYLPSLEGFGLSNSIRFFINCTSLKCLVFSQNTVVPILKNPAGLEHLYDGTAPDVHVYVPSALVSEYQAATGWSTIYAQKSDIFRPLENYTVDGTTTGDIDETKI